ncbi:MAG: hypothetical protein ACI8PZ_004916 [Myxococcota bacterium]|jgi:hypothetical protein
MQAAFTILCFALLWWSPVALAQGLGSFISPGELASPHADLDGLQNCVQCHAMGEGVSASRCMECHERVADQVSTKTGFHADKSASCESCHPDHRGRDFEMVRLDEEEFDHDATGFALRGAHARTICADCHGPDGDWTGQDQMCASCHEDPHGSAVGRPLLKECGSCHNVADWKVSLAFLGGVFDHDAPDQADFALHGQHADVACADCHDDALFVPVDADACLDCHDNPHGTQFDPRTCEDCHTTEHAGFTLPGFDHEQTRWPLRGAHRRTGCASCHGDGPEAVFVGLSFARCDDCHDDVHEGQFQPRDCGSCHTQTRFTDGTFDHDATDFPLRGEHQSVACDDCHGEGPTATFAGLPFDDCASCHDDVHEARFAPDRCDSCHIDGTWGVESFDHERTDYPLTGAHTDVACAECHGAPPDEVFAPIPFGSCLDCHADDDPHAGGFGGERCDSCHATAAWADVSFDHATETGFALLGEHTPLACADCHDEPAYAGETAVCESCHRGDEPDDHYDGDCGDCHQVTGWLPALLRADDHASTGFPLRGAHASVGCADCHHTDAVSPFCADCHDSDDPHRNLLGNRCDQCHGPGDWLLTRFNHASTGFPLRGPHKLARCIDCHATGYAGTPDSCRRCHDNEKPRDAIHADPVTRDCQACHRPYDWDLVRFPHGGL